MTLTKVIHNIFTSKLNDCFSTYSTSSLNFCSQLIALRPFTCAQPVIPGLTICLLACSGLYHKRYRINNGLGPTKIISPFNTFINCRSSSNDAQLIIPIALVFLNSAGKIIPTCFKLYNLKHLVIKS